VVVETLQISLYELSKYGIVDSCRASVSVAENDLLQVNAFYGQAQS